MSNALTPIITNKGRQALMSGFSTPNNYRFSHVALGDANGAGYEANPLKTALKHELQRVEIESVIVQDTNRLHITAVAGLPKDNEPEEAYDIHEIGFFLQFMNTDGKDQDDPLLFAIYATKPGIDEKALLTKEPDTELLLAFDLILPDLGDSDFKFDSDSYLHIPRATTEITGMVRMAEEAEILAGEKNDLAISPLGLNTVLKKAVESRFADDEQTLAGKSSILAVTPAGLKQTLTSQFADIDEAVAGESSSLAVTPEGLKQALTTQLATSDEAIAGESEDKVITPSGLKSVLDKETVTLPVMEAAFLENLATKAEAVAGLAGDKAVTPTGLQAKFDEIEKTSASVMKDVILDSLATKEEAVAGTAGDKAVTPIGLQAKFDEIEKQGSSDTVKDLTVNGAASFGSSVRQKINLWKTKYGIGIQNSTQYYRTGKNFAWYNQGVHDNNELNPGEGGRVDMVLKDGKLGIGTADPESTLTIAKKDGKESNPNANLHITANSILFGGNNSGKQAHSAHISAGLHVANSLNLVGMSSDTNANTRKIDMWAEGGLSIRGKVNITDGLLTTNSNASIGGKLEVAKNTVLSGHLSVGNKLKVDKTTVSLGGFTDEEKDEWPFVAWLSDYNKKWDEGLIKYAKDKGMFGRSGFGIHLHETREWNFFSTGWNALFGIEGKTGNTEIKGNLTVGGQVKITEGLKPNFDSGWHHISNPVENQEFTFNHNLGTYPAIVQLFAKSDGKKNGESLKDKSDVRIMSFLNDCFHKSDNDRAGFSCRRLTTSVIKLFKPSKHIWHGNGPEECFNTGYIRILMWKGFSG